MLSRIRCASAPLLISLAFLCSSCSQWPQAESNGTDVGGRIAGAWMTPSQEVLFTVDSGSSAAAWYISPSLAGAADARVEFLSQSQPVCWVALVGRLHSVGPVSKTAGGASYIHLTGLTPKVAVNRGAPELARRRVLPVCEQLSEAARALLKNNRGALSVRLLSLSGSHLEIGLSKCDFLPCTPADPQMKAASMVLFKVPLSELPAEDPKSEAKTLW